MGSILFILNDAPYGNERAYNALRLAAVLAGQEGQQLRLFLMADAVACAKTGQKVPEGYYNIQLMLGKVIRNGEVGLCPASTILSGVLPQEGMLPGDWLSLVPGHRPFHLWWTAFWAVAIVGSAAA